MPPRQSTTEAATAMFFLRVAAGDSQSNVLFLDTTRPPDRSTASTATPRTAPDDGEALRVVAATN